MKALEKRVLAALGTEDGKSTWEELIGLFQADREAFFLLANADPSTADSTVADLAILASAVRAAIRETYEIVPSATGATLASFTGKQTGIPGHLVPMVARFLREIDGKTTTTTAGKDFEGEAISEAEIDFKLGDEATWEAESHTLESRRNAKPLVFQLDPEDLEHLKTQPAYVTYELLHCARKTMLAPTVVFKGLKRGGDGPPKVNEGWAFFGKPRQAYGNDGAPGPVPAGMVFVVYADRDRFVFDWDWVQEDPDKPGYPLGPLDDRFETEINLEQDAVLDLPKDLRPGQFDPKKACYSNRGDCIFCYMTDEKSHAVRINADLTVFQKLGTNEHTGFKIKNIQRIVQVDKKIVVSDPPGLTLSVDSVLLAVSRRQQESVEFYAVLIRRLHTSSGQPKVSLPPAPTDKPPMVEDEKAPELVS